MQFKDKVVNLAAGWGVGVGGNPAENELQGLDYDQSVEGQKAKGKGKEAK